MSSKRSRDRRGQPVPRRPLRGDARRGHAARTSRSVRRDPRRPQRRLRAQRPEPAAPPDRPLPLVRRRRHGARRSLRRRDGHLPQPLGPHRGLPRRARRGDARSGAGSSSRSARTPPTRRRRTPRTPTSCSTATGCSRSGTGRASRTRSTRSRSRRSAPRTSAARCAARSPRTRRSTSDTGELMFFDYGMKPPYMRYGVVGPEGAVRHFVADRPAGPAPAARHGDHRAPLDPDGPAALRRPRGGAPRPASSSTSSATCRRASA